MALSSSNCHIFSTNVKQSLADFNIELNQRLRQQKLLLKFSLNNRQIPLFMAQLAEFEPSILYAYDGSVKRGWDILDEIRGWSELLNVRNDWHLLSDSLSEQEISGEVVSKLGQTYHQLLSRLATNSITGHFALPISNIKLEIPNPLVYQKNIITIHAGEAASITSLLTELTQRGYTRYDKQLEAGGLRVRGEQIDLKHPLWDGYYTITFYGRNIENIVSHQGPRSQRVPRLKILPVNFPAQTVALSRALSSILVVRPGYLEELSGTRQIFFDSNQPDIAFPWQSAPEKISKPFRLLVLYENLDRTRHFLNSSGLTKNSLCRSALAKYKIRLDCGTNIIVSESALLPKIEGQEPLPYEAGLKLLAQLTPGRPAVHSDHGIGIYEGLQTKTIGGDTREYLLLRYAGGDTVSVPVEYAYKVSAYIGETQPPLHRLGGRDWVSVRKRARQDAAAFARELIKIASERSSSRRESYIIDEKVEQDLAQTFPFELTPDQFRAWEDIKEGLTRPHPIDALVVGDVGFGKTELAIRAARHVINNGKQVAVLSPTTLLTQQHFDTFQQRLRLPAGRLAQLSRFSTPSQQARVRGDIAAGQVQIAIGTHALLSKTTTWHNLGLVIIDEEQRFGVKHKEHFKTLRASLDVLALSATPIPRTLGMALSGLKQLAVINTPPPGRKNVVTKVARENSEVIKQAIIFELKRGGQTYVVAPKVRGLNALAHEIRQAVPEARVAVAHGRLPASELARIMSRFDAGEIDVLVSSSIVENGLDLPRANTIVVTQATRFGLADLYQLRGRVGRRHHQGFAYFLYHQHELALPERQRLAALIEASHLGSGWTLAQRDLEIRGAGNLLGAEQSGVVNEVGVQLYLDLIHEARDESDRPLSRHDVEITLPLPAAIPPHYLADATARLQVYQRLSRLGSATALETEIKHLARQYGAPPLEARHLHAILLLQILASKIGIKRVASQKITPPETAAFDRLLIEGVNLPGILKKVGALSSWSVLQNRLVKDVPRLDLSFLDELISSLSETPYSILDFYASIK